MQKIIDGTKHGYDGDFVVKTYTYGDIADIEDEIMTALAEITKVGAGNKPSDYQMNIRPRAGITRIIQLKYGIKSAPVDITIDNIKEFPQSLGKELYEAVLEVNDNVLPFGGSPSTGMPS